MREILFKGKAESNNEWVQGDLVQNNKHTSIRLKTWNEYNGWLTYEVAPETVGQYIGFCDKKGNKIFEGDLVEIQHPCWTAKCVTVFRDGAFYFEEINNPISNSQVRADTFLQEKWQIEIVGNTNDN